MFWKISKRVAGYLVSGEDENEMEIYTYGVWVLLTTFLSVLEVLFLGFISHCLVESVIYLLILMVLRTYTGGYHASTSGKCNLLVICCFFVNVLLSKMLFYLDNTWITGGILLISMVIILWKAPVEHENKPLSDKEKVRYRRYSIVLSVIICFIVVCLYANCKFQMIYTVASMLMVALMMVVELMLQYRRCAGGQISEEEKK